MANQGPPKTMFQSQMTLMHPAEEDYHEYNDSFIGTEPSKASRGGLSGWRA